MQPLIFNPHAIARLAEIGFFKVFAEVPPFGGGRYRKHRMDDFTGTYCAIYHGKPEIMIFEWQNTVRYIPLMDILQYGIGVIGDAFDDFKVTPYGQC
jgi:hypothetical protein